MALPPFWKVRRELLRIYDTSARVVVRWTYEPLRKIVYDLTASRLQTLTPGALPLTRRVAIFVVFQPNGLAKSVLLTLDHLRQNGFSTFVVSNGPLRAEDRIALAGNAALVMERPNIGYDFGAYRDGIRHLWSLKHDLSRLVLLNDSTWFPLWRDDDSLARIEALDADLAGHIFKTEDERNRHNDHVESHLLMISEAFFRSADFRNFWSSYWMSDYRRTTIEAGEKGISQLALRTGRSVKSLMSREWLMSLLRDMDDEELRQVLDRTDDSFRGRQKDATPIRTAAARGLPWREQYLEWVDQALSNSRTFLLSSTFVMPALVYGKMGFAKKANDIRFHLARQETLRLEASGMIQPLDEIVRAEISQAVRSWKSENGQKNTPRRRSTLPAEVSSQR